MSNNAGVGADVLFCFCFFVFFLLFYFPQAKSFNFYSENKTAPNTMDDR